MGKAKRGRNIKSTANWRGVCPVCKREGVKLLWEKTGEDNAKLKVCKACGA